MMRMPWLAGPLFLYRLDRLVHSSGWDRGVGAAKEGGRWNPQQFPVTYCSADAATAIMEVAVHVGFETLDTVPYVLTVASVTMLDGIHVVAPDDLPNSAWLHSGPPSKGQQKYGRELLEKHAFVLVPSVVVGESWNVLFNPIVAEGRYQLESQRRFSLDTRLSPP